MIFLSWPALQPRPATLHQPGRRVHDLLQDRVPGFRVGFAEENLGQVEKESHLPFSLNIPDRAGTIAELYEGRALPGVLVRLMTDTPWCNELQEYTPWMTQQESTSH